MHGCFIVDGENFPNLAADYELFPCDEINKYYLSYAFFKWTDASQNPTFADLSNTYNMTLYIRSSKDPYVVGYTKANITSESNGKKLKLLLI
jgi:hypothetical protein